MHDKTFRVSVGVLCRLVVPDGMQGLYRELC